MRRLAVALGLALALAGSAAAGGDRTDLVVHAGTVWTVGTFGVHGYAARDGRLRFAPRPTSVRYDLSAATTGDALFVGSVENGMTDGTITRIDLRTHGARVVWHSARAAVQDVAAGAGGVYALVGAKHSAVILISAGGTVTARWPIVDAGRIAADASGCWVAADHRILHIRSNGRIVEVLTTPGLEDVATGGGAAWFIAQGELTRIDERSGVVRGLRVGGLQPLGSSHELAVGAGALWTVNGVALQRRSLATGRLERARSLGSPLVGSVAVANGVVWVVSSESLYRLDPRTLRITLRVPLV